MILEGLDQAFLAEFPEFTDSYKREFDYWVDWERAPGSYLVFGLVVFPNLISLLDSGKDDQLTRRLFEFLERMSLSKDLYVLDLLNLEVIHKLLHDPDRLRKAWPYMGRKTREVAGDAAKALRLQIDFGNL